MKPEQLYSAPMLVLSGGLLKVTRLPAPPKRVPPARH